MKQHLFLGTFYVALSFYLFYDWTDVYVVHKRFASWFWHSRIFLLCVHRTGWPEPGGLLPREALKLVGLIASHIEQRLQIKIDRKSLDYKRLIRHLRSAIERVSKGEYLEAPEKVEKLLREEYPLCYDTAWELMSIMERQLKKAVPRGEATYLTMHLQRLVQYDLGK